VGVRLAAPKNEALFCVSLGFAISVQALSVVGRRQNAARSTAATTMVLSQKEADVQMMLAADVHLGTKNCDFQMERYVWKRRSDGIFIINVGKTWDKLQLAARVIVAIENPQDIIVQSARPYGQRAVLKFAQYTGCQAIAGRHTPGTFTNQLQNTFSEPRLLILTDPRTDHQVSISDIIVSSLVIGFFLLRLHYSREFLFLKGMMDIERCWIGDCCSQLGKQLLETFL
jgi:ribosomal protein uS2